MIVVILGHCPSFFYPLEDRGQLNEASELVALSDPLCHDSLITGSHDTS